MKRYYLDRKLHRKIRSALRREKREYGGSLQLVCGQEAGRQDRDESDAADATDGADSKCVFKDKEIKSGGYDHVDIDRTTLADWHLHPARCLNDDKCAVGVPSPDDMQNIAEGFFDKSMFHFVYSAEGTYLIEPEWASAYLQSLKSHHAAGHSGMFKRELKSLNAVFEDLFQRWVKGDWPYSEYREQWQRMAADHGFKVSFFRGDKLPYVLMDSTRHGYEFECPIGATCIWDTARHNSATRIR